MDPSFVYDNINLGRRIDVQWPNEEWRLKGGKNHWLGWVPEKHMEGPVVHKWIPCHRYGFFSHLLTAGSPIYDSLGGWIVHISALFATLVKSCPYFEPKKCIILLP